MTDVENYAILAEQSPQSLVVKVSDAIKRGWQPLGGVQVTFNSHGLPVLYVQTVVTVKALIIKP